MYKTKTEEEMVNRKKVLEDLKRNLHYLATGAIYGTFSYKELREGLKLKITDGDLEEHIFTIKLT